MKARAIELGGAKLLFTNTANAELKLPGGGRGGKGLHPCALYPLPCVCLRHMDGIYANCAEYVESRIDSTALFQGSLSQPGPLGLPEPGGGGSCMPYPPLEIENLPRHGQCRVEDVVCEYELLRANKWIVTVSLSVLACLLLFSQLAKTFACPIEKPHARLG